MNHFDPVARRRSFAMISPPSSCLPLRLGASPLGALASKAGSQSSTVRQADRGNAHQDLTIYGTLNRRRK
jgi:hypothetical protein